MKVKNHNYLINVLKVSLTFGLLVIFHATFGQILNSAQSGLYSAPSTWRTTGSGTITTVNSGTATAKKTVTGVGTNFTNSLVKLQLFQSDGTTLIGTVESVTNPNTLVLTAEALVLTTATGYKYGLTPGNFTVNADHAITIDQNISISYPANYTINAPLLDPIDPTDFTITIAGQTITNRGIFTVNANTTFEGTLNVANRGHLIINGGDTMRVGAATFGGNSYVTINTGGVLIVNGNLTNGNNNDAVIINGQLIVLGNIDNGTGSDIGGTGSIIATGTITDSGSMFGTEADCGTGPCAPTSANGNTCPFSTTAARSQSTCTGVTPELLTAITDASSPTY